MNYTCHDDSSLYVVSLVLLSLRCRTAYYQTGFLHYLLHQYLGKIWGREKLLVPLNHMLKKYYTQSDEQDDLISIGTIGLIKGISTFKPEKGARLATYAAPLRRENAILSQRNNRRLRWKTMNHLGQNGLCSAA